MKYVCMILAVVMGSVSCNAQPGNKLKSAEVKMIPENEPGKPLTLDITVLDLNTRKPVRDAEVFAYQTNHLGDYERVNGVARIHGTAWSNNMGWMRFITIYPRGYNNSNTGEHIHFEIKAKGYRQTNSELLFLEYYSGQYDFKNPVTGKVYLESLEEKDGKMKGKALIFLHK